MQVSKRLLSLVSLLMIITIFMTACGTPAATTTAPTTAPAAAEPTEAPAAAEPTAAEPTEAAEATMAPEMTMAAEATMAPEATEAAEATTAPAASGDQEPVIVLQGVDATTLDPQFSGSLPGANIMNHVFDRLTTQGIDAKLEPMLATEWAMDEADKTKWTFKLNPDAKFSDGEPVTSADVIFTWKRASDPENKITGNTAYLLNNMKIVDITAADDHTLTIQSETPSITLPGFLAEFYIIPQHYYEGLDLEAASLKPLGSGPYTVTEWVKDDHLTMIRNENYWGTPAEIESIIWRPVPEAATRLAELQSGGADIIDNLPPDRVKDVEDAGLRAVNVATGRRIFIGLTQYNNDALKDKRVRQAMNYAVDFDAISEALLGGAGKRTGSNVNPPWQNPEVTPYEYDVEKAKALLTEAGYTDADGNGFVEKDGTELSLLFDSPNGRYIRDLQIAQAVAQYLMDAGINVEVAPQEWSNYTPRLDAKTLDDIYLIGSGSNFEGQADISDLQKDSSSNYAQWSNDEFEALFEQLRSELDLEKRAELLNQMQVLVKDEAPYIFLYMQVAFFGTSDRMANWQPYPNERIHLENVSLK